MTKTRIKRSNTGHLVIEKDENSFVIEDFSAPVAEVVRELYGVAEQVQAVGTMIMNDYQLHTILSKKYPELLKTIAEADRKARHIMYGID
jgi:hypothetical protein